MARSKSSVPLGEDAARRAVARQAEKAARESGALRANLQRRKTQARERATPEPETFDARPTERQNDSF